MNATQPKLSLAYLHTVFPATSHTFISREILGLENYGVEIKHLSVHAPEAFEVSAEDAVFKDKVFYVFPLNKLAFIKAHLEFLWRMPGKYFYWMYYVVSRRETKLRDRLRSFFHFLEAIYLAKEVERQGIRHVHAHFFQGNATIGIILSKLLGITYSVTGHGTALLVDRVLIKEKLEHAKFVIAISQYNKNFMLKVLPDCESKVFVVHCGLNPDKFLPAPPRKNAVFTLLAVGRMVWEKAYDYLIETCKILRDEGCAFQCIVIGTGPEREKIETLIERYDLWQHIKLAGLVLQERIQEYYNQADAFILTSISEGIPVVIMEAMSKELPVVASRITGIPELVEDGVTGYLVPAKQPQAYADAVKKLMADHEQCLLMGRQGRQKILAEFDIEKNIRQRYDVYHTQLTGDVL